MALTKASTIRTATFAGIGVLIVFVLIGCPTHKGGNVSKVNIDSVLKANKAIADSALKIAPTPAVEILMDSLKTVLGIASTISDATVATWLSPVPTHVPTDEPSGCSLVIVHFTDMEVSELFNRVSVEFPGQINVLIGQMAAPIFTGQPFFLAPNVYSNSCDPARSADWVPYDLTPSQLTRWNLTTPAVKSLFIGALNAYQSSLTGTTGIRNVLWITNLSHGNLGTAPYTHVIYSVTPYSASTRMHVIQLMN